MARKKTQPESMFQEGEDLPLFSGTPQSVEGERFEPKERGVQPVLPGMPGVDYEHIYKKDQAKRRQSVAVAYLVRGEKEQAHCLECVPMDLMNDPAVSMPCVFDAHRPRYLRGLRCARCDAEIFPPAW
jgi:hypothetical protein